MGREIRKKIIAWDTAPDEDFFKELRRVSRNQIIWGANYFPNMPPTRCFVVWRKLTISEDFSMAMAEYAWTSFNGNAKVFECAPQGKPGDERFHPTQKPVALYSWLINRFWKGGTIFDPMMGSQSSRIAAHFAGADFVGRELDPQYYDAGCARFEKASRQLLLPL
jgi:site-specific DNA-methyltransferase (adenine-specific)